MEVNFKIKNLIKVIYNGNELFEKIFSALLIKKTQNQLTT